MVTVQPRLFSPLALASVLRSFSVLCPWPLNSPSLVGGVDDDLAGLDLWCGLTWDDRPVDMVYGSFIVSIDQHFLQPNSHPRGAETSATAFHVLDRCLDYGATCFHLGDSNIPTVSAPLSISAVREDAATTHQQVPAAIPFSVTAHLALSRLAYYHPHPSSCIIPLTSPLTSRVYHDTRQILLILHLLSFSSPSPPAHPLATTPAAPPPLANGGALSSSSGACHRTPKSFGGRIQLTILALWPSPTTTRLFVDVTGVIVELGLAHPPAPWATPVLAQYSLVLYTARASNAFGFECRRGRPCGWPGCGLAQNRAGSAECRARSVLILVCDIHPHHAHLGQALSMETPSTHAWRMQKKALPYAVPETLRAQASVASGPARASASTTTLCRCYSPRFTNYPKLELPSVRGDGYVPDVVILPRVMFSSNN
ncbi:hypothetical protein B0H13DRAFT_2568443 [Mycena leptocephala]|nr:hypothetical protein B0H13DRAFT_2568443 [Mycena leptocephala]